MSCSCDRSLENGMKSTMLRRALDLLEPATRKVFLLLLFFCCLTDAYYKLALLIAHAEVYLYGIFDFIA